MTLPTVTISIAAATSSGTIPDDAVVTFELDGADVDALSGEIVIPDRTSVTLVNGIGTINKWPNGRGTQSTQYIVTIEGTSYRIAKRVTVPDANCDLYTLMQFATVAPDAASAAEIAAQGYAADARNAAETSVATAATATPTSSDTVVGVTAAGAVRRFDASPDAIGLADYTALRAYAGTHKAVQITGYLVTSAPSGTAGYFTRDDSDTTSADNGGTIIVASNGKRWKRVYDGAVNAKWFGAVLNGVADDRAAIQASIDAMYADAGGVVRVPFGIGIVGAALELKPGVFLIGDGQNATELRASGNFPVISVSGANGSVKNRGGASNMLIRGGGKANTNAFGIKLEWANRYTFENLRFHGCYIGMYASNVWQVKWDNLHADGGGSDQNYIGFYMAEVDPSNQNNAVQAINCMAQNCELYNWRLINFNGSKFINCEGSGAATNAWYLGSPTTGTEAVRWGHFVNCLGDTSSSDNWKIERGSASSLKQIQFTNCWAGTSTGGHGWSIIDASQLLFSALMVVESNASAMKFLRSSRCVINGSQFLEYDGAATLNGAIALENSSYIEITGSHAYTTHSAAKGIVESGTSDNTLAIGNYLPGVTKTGANSRFMRNNGVGGERVGSAQITAAATSVTVTHNMEFAPSINDVRLTPRDDMGAASKLSAQNMTATTFDIVADAAPGSTITIAWAIDPIGQ